MDVKTNNYLWDLYVDIAMDVKTNKYLWNLYTDIQWM
jgi:hypothetical protein